MSTKKALCSGGAVFAKDWEKQNTETNTTDKTEQALDYQSAIIYTHNTYLQNTVLFAI